MYTFVSDFLQYWNLCVCSEHVCSGQNANPNDTTSILCQKQEGKIVYSF